MADKNVSIKFKSDTKEAKKNIDNLTSSLNKLGKDAKNDSVSKLGDAWKRTSNTIKSAGLGAVIAAEVKLLKQELQAIKDTAEAFNVQLKAETKLAQAAKNNPYMDGTGVNRLKEFAGQLQSISDYGDEELIPMMTELVASGRTEAQVMDIMSASIDIAAGTGKNLQSVVEQLNKSFTGEAGRLSQLSGEVKGLTKEQLQSGEAVKVLAEQYKGLSEEATKATGSAKQLAMAQGDLAESWGKITKPAYDSWNNFWLRQTKKAQEFAENVNKALEKASQTWVIGGGYRSNKEFVKNTLAEAKDADKDGNRRLYLEDVAGAQNNEALGNAINYLSNLKKRKAEETELLNILKEEQNWRAKKTENEQMDAKAAQEAATMTTKQLRERLETLRTAATLEKADYKLQYAVRMELEKREAEEAAIQSELLDKYNETVAAQEKELAIRKQAGTQISQEDELRKMLNTKLEAYVKFIKDGGDTTSSAAVKIRAEIKKMSADLATMEEAEKARLEAEKEEERRVKAIKDQLDAMNDKVLKLKESANELINGPQEVKLSDTIQQTIDALEVEAEALDHESAAYADYIEKLKELKELLPQVQEAEEKAAQGHGRTIDNVNSVMSQITDSMQSLTNSISQISQTALSEANRQYDKDAKALEMQLDNDIITYDEYLEKKDQLDKEAAQKEYKIKMAEWSMNLAMATAQAAQAVVNALASGTPPVNVINATTAGLLGAAQLIAIAGAKPRAPSFSTGGFLTGNSYHGDKIAFNGNAGEAILNPAEQRAFLDLANGEGGKGVVVNMPVNIENNAGDAVQVSAMQQDRQIKITVDKIVNSTMQSGGYNNALQSANASMKGARYL